MYHHHRCINPRRHLIIATIGAALCVMGLPGESGAVNYSRQQTATQASVLPVVAAASSSASKVKHLDLILSQAVAANKQLGSNSAAKALKSNNRLLKIGNINGKPYIVVDVVAGNVNAVSQQLTQAGMVHLRSYSNVISGLMPLEGIQKLSSMNYLRSARASLMRSRAAAGPLAVQGDYAQRSFLLKSVVPGLTGKGVSVGVISNSFNCYAQYAVPGSGVVQFYNNGYATSGFSATYSDDVASGALPGTVKVLEEDQCFGFDPTYGSPDDDEGRGMVQIVHAVAPDAGLMFYTGDIGLADFANGISALAMAGAKVIVDDLINYDEPFFQDGLISQAVNSVAALNVAYFSSAGNDGHAAQQVFEVPNKANPSLTPSFLALATSYDPAVAASAIKWLNFDTTGRTAQTTIPVTIPVLSPSESIPLIVQWDDSFITGYPNSAGARALIDVCITGFPATSNDYVVADFSSNPATNTYCTGPAEAGSDPVQILQVGLPATAFGTSSAVNFNVSIGILNSSTRVPMAIKFQISDDGAGAVITKFANFNGSMQGHATAAGAIAVAAMPAAASPDCGNPVTPTLESFSSAGSDPIFFNSSGARLGSPIYTQKPDITAPDRVNTTMMGWVQTQDPLYVLPGCQISLNYPAFLGTSSAAPHAAAVAALLLQANPQLTPNQIKSTLTLTARQFDTVNPSSSWGAGLISADAAYQLVGPPTLQVDNPQVTVGSSVNVSWSAPSQASGCTASGDWAGGLGSSGTRQITANQPGTLTFNIACSTVVGARTSNSISVAVVLPTPTITVNPSVVNIGDTASLHWDATGYASCAASDAWSGTLTLSGTQTITASHSGSQAYTITCLDNSSRSATATVNLQVNTLPQVVNVSSTKSGGGAIDLVTLAILSLLVTVVWFRKGH